MSGLTEDFKVLKSVGQEKHAHNIEQSAAYLRNACIMFTEHNNNGAHLVVEGKDGYIYFWPDTDKWIARNGKSGFGVKNLVDYIKGSQDKRTANYAVQGSISFDLDKYVGQAIHEIEAAGITATVKVFISDILYMCSEEDIPKVIAILKSIPVELKHDITS